MEVTYGFLAGMGLGLALHYGYARLRKKEVLGYGDVKFLAVAGAWLTLMPFVPFLLLSGLLGIALGVCWRAFGKGEYFPFGPALALSLFLCVVFPFIVGAFWNIGHSITSM